MPHTLVAVAGGGGGTAGASKLVMRSRECDVSFDQTHAWQTKKDDRRPTTTTFGRELPRYVALAR